MNIPASVLDKAYSIYDEWGPKRQIERKQRLGEEFNQLSSQEIEQVLDIMKKVVDTVWDIAKQGGEAKLGKARVAKLLQEKHPFLESDGLERALFLVNYYAWHEGYDK
jgi:hypothetical protein